MLLQDALRAGAHARQVLGRIDQAVDAVEEDQQALLAQGVTDKQIRGVVTGALGAADRRMLLVGAV